MFTGIVQVVGKIKSAQHQGQGTLLIIEAPETFCHEIQINDSVSVNGVCQTAVAVEKNSFSVQAIFATLEKTNLGKLKAGAQVNLELAMRPMDRFGGHFVSGHVQATCKLLKIENRSDARQLFFSFPEHLGKYLLDEGSVTLNGVSLTIFKKETHHFSVALIPHTLAKTNIAHLNVGEDVNLEVDLLAKYVEALLKPHASKSGTKSEASFDWNSFLGGASER